MNHSGFDLEPGWFFSAFWGWDFGSRFKRNGANRGLEPGKKSVCVFWAILGCVAGFEDEGNAPFPGLKYRFPKARESSEIGM